MPTPSSGRESRRSSKSGPSGNDAFRSSDRREKAKSSQIYDSKRRGSRQAESGLGSLNERPQLKGRTNSAPLIEPRTRHDGGRVAQTDGSSTGASTPRARENDIEDAQDEDEVAGVVGAVRNLQPFQNPEISEPVPDINIAVVGADGGERSAFIINAFNLSSPPSGQAAEKKLSIKGEEYVVRLLDLPIEDVDVDDDDDFTVSWPEDIDGKMMPRIDGAVTLYDIKDQSCLEYVPQILRAVSKTGLPSLLVACNCNASPEEIEIDPDEYEQKAKKALKSLETLQTSSTTPATQKQGLTMIIKSILASYASTQSRSLSAQRRRAQSNAVRSTSPRPPSHTRATSEYTGSMRSKEPPHSRHDSSGPGYQPKDRLKVQPEQNTNEMAGSFFLEESASEASFDSTRLSVDGNPFVPAIVQPISALSENGATFDELVDRLLAQPTSKADEKFSAIFLALYRNFAAPGRLLEAVVERFDALDRDGSADLLRTTSKLRYVYILETWVGTYPGDFAFPKTKKRMRTFISKASREQIFAAAAKQINAELDGVQEDDDTNWGYCDKDRVLSGPNDVHWVSMSTTASKLIDDPTWSFGSDFTLSGSTLLDDPSINAATEADVTRSMSSSTLSSQVMVSAEAAQRQAELLGPTSRISLSKFQWRALMEFPDDLIARELTRIDWIMFSSIRPRDLVRQVSLNDEQKTACKNLSHVSRMSNHFNHLAFWVTNYILLRDKPKHRALMLEKLMRIARKLREMNNYNALGAVIAGIKSTPIHRLAATRELIPPTIGKDWMKLEILMAPTRSYFAYRLAWENSSTERIPYIPLHMRDLVSAEQGNKTFLGDEATERINWKKFEIIGEVIVSMQKAQGMPYRGLVSSKGGEQLKELVLDVRLQKDEDNLDERSKQVEPTGTASGTTSSKVREFFKR